MDLVPRKHDGWSVAIIISDCVAGCVEQIAESVRMAATAIAQHTVQINNDHEFSNMMEDYDDDAS